MKHPHHALGQIQKQQTVQYKIIFFLPGSNPDTDQKIIDGNIDIIFASPESLVGDAQFRANLQNLDVSLIVID